VLMIEVHGVGELTTLMIHIGFISVSSVSVFGQQK
jgi:hypothetical protein